MEFSIFNFQFLNRKIFNASSLCCIIIFAFCISNKVYAAQIYLLPPIAEIEAGDTLLSELRIDTEGEQLNAFDILMTYPADVLEISQMITGDSLINFWIRKPVYSNEHGILRIEGGRTGGLSGEGLLLKILFKAKSAGEAVVSFDDSSQVLLHDGLGTPTQGVFSEARYSVRNQIVRAVDLKSETHPREDTWYKTKTIDVQWEHEEGAVYSYVLSADVMENPDNEADEPVANVTYTNPADGIYYFSIKESLDGGRTWSRISRRGFLQDKTSPEKFKISVVKDENAYEGQPFATFAADDNTSGIDHYEIGEQWIKSPHLLEGISSWSIIKVKAVDMAGNERIEKFVPVRIRLLAFFLLFIFLFATLFFLWRRYMKKRI